MGTVLLRFGELFLKSESVRRIFMETLRRNLEKALAASDIVHEVEVRRDRVLVHGPDPEGIAGVAARTFGIVMSPSAPGPGRASRRWERRPSNGRAGTCGRG